MMLWPAALWWFQKKGNGGQYAPRCGSGLREDRINALCVFIALTQLFVMFLTEFGERNTCRN
jgi:hypothetical protein